MPAQVSAYTWTPPVITEANPHVSPVFVDLVRDTQAVVYQFPDPSAVIAGPNTVGMCV